MTIFLWIIGLAAWVLAAIGVKFWIPRDSNGLLSFGAGFVGLGSLILSGILAGLWLIIVIIRAME